MPQDYLDFYPDLAMATAPLLAWYSQVKRPLPWRENADPYRVWVSEIMLQQTRVGAVVPYFNRFMGTFSDVFHLASASDELLLKCWEGLGYYSRARNLKKAAQVVVEKYGGVFPDDYDSWLALPGVGPYTAGAVCSIAFSRPVPAVDGNVLRVFSRLTSCEDDITSPQTKKALSALVAALVPAKNPGDYNQALMELGATICLPGAARCGDCPILSRCTAGQNGTAHLFPVKPAKKPRKQENRTVFILQYGEKYAICKRPDTGLLAGLWQFPNADGHLHADEATAWLAPYIKLKKTPTKLAAAEHIFTHKIWRMTGWYAEVDALLPGCPFTWAKRADLQDTYAIASAFSAYRP